MSKSLGQIAYEAAQNRLAECTDWDAVAAAVRDAVLAEGVADWQDEYNPLTTLVNLDKVLAEAGVKEDSSSRHQLSIAISHLRSLLSRHAAEVIAIRSELEEHSRAGFEMSAELESLLIEVASLRRNDARYRWLRSGKAGMLPISEVDIDAALAGEG
jgi:hypothetical protein